MSDRTVQIYGPTHSSSFISSSVIRRLNPAATLLRFSEVGSEMRAPLASLTVRGSVTLELPRNFVEKNGSPLPRASSLLEDPKVGRYVPFLQVYRKMSQRARRYTTLGIPQLHLHTRRHTLWKFECEEAPQRKILLMWMSQRPAHGSNTMPCYMPSYVFCLTILWYSAMFSMAQHGRIPSNQQTRVAFR